MNLQNAQLGEKYKFYISGMGAITNNISWFVKSGTIVGLSKNGDDVVIGWKPNDDAPLQGTYLNQLMLTNYDYAADYHDYTQIFYAHRTLEVFDKIEPIKFTVSLSKTISQIDGLNCKKCNEYYQYSTSNQPDGTLICYSCRQRRY